MGKGGYAGGCKACGSGYTGALAGYGSKGGSYRSGMAYGAQRSYGMRSRTGAPIRPYSPTPIPYSRGPSLYASKSSAYTPYHSYARPPALSGYNSFDRKDPFVQAMQEYAARMVDQMNRVEEEKKRKREDAAGDTQGRYANPASRYTDMMPLGMVANASQPVMVQSRPALPSAPALVPAFPIIYTAPLMPAAAGKKY